jgi:cold shock CspA family protein
MCCDRMMQGDAAAEHQHGWVRTFIADRGFGFIAGDDRQEYFFHLDDVTGRGAPSTGQAVSFTPGRTAKGLRARSVAVSGHAPQARKVYLDPDHFIMTRAPEVRGFVIVQVLSPVVVVAILLGDPVPQPRDRLA